MSERSYCGDCPDREACHIGYTCAFVRATQAKFDQLDAVTTEEGTNTMSNTTNTKTTVTPADVVAEAKKEKLVTEVPAQGNTEDKTTKEKAAEVVEETAEAAKKTVKDRVSALASKAKKNRQFFLGLLTGAVSTAAVMVLAAKEKVEEVVELTVVEEPVSEDDTDESAA